MQITKDGNKTVIITTHYIEEARQAHTVRRTYAMQTMWNKNYSGHNVDAHVGIQMAMQRSISAKQNRPLITHAILNRV